MNEDSSQKNKKKTSADFNIPQGMEEKYPELIDLVINTESMNDNERQYWFSILPAMNEEQINRLKEILEEEKRKLSELDQKYESELREIAEKHFLEKTEKERKDNWEKIKETEEKDKKEDEQALGDVLSQLDDV